MVHGVRKQLRICSKGLEEPQVSDPPIMQLVGLRFR